MQRLRLRSNHALIFRAHGPIHEDLRILLQVLLDFRVLVQQLLKFGVVLLELLVVHEGRIPGEFL